MSIAPEALYAHLRQLVASMPVLGGAAPLAIETQQWLGKAAALVEVGGTQAERITFNVAAEGLDSVLRQQNAQAITAIVHRVLARAELAAPVSAQGAFLAAGEPFSALVAVAKVFGRAKSNLLIVDKYAEASLVTEFLGSAPEGVALQILTMQKDSKRTTLKPAADRWVEEFNVARPLAVRMVPAAQLHDRLILVDSTEAWVTGQSFKQLAESTPTYLSQLDADIAEAKVAAYRALWGQGEPL